MMNIFMILMIISMLILIILLLAIITEKYWHKNYLCRKCYDEGKETRITQYIHDKNNGNCENHK